MFELCKKEKFRKMKESNNCLTCGCEINPGCLYCIDCVEEVIEKSLQSYMENPKWNGKLFMQDEKTCYKDGFQDGVNSIDSQVKSLEEENRKLKARIRMYMTCGYCKHLENEPSEICTPCLCGEVDNWKV